VNSRTHVYSLLKCHSFSEDRVKRVLTDIRKHWQVQGSPKLPYQRVHVQKQIPPVVRLPFDPPAGGAAKNLRPHVFSGEVLPESHGFDADAFPRGFPTGLLQLTAHARNLRQGIGVKCTYRLLL
jgi:hypothetical protein